MRKDFSLYPSVKFNRTKFDLSHNVKTSMSVGTLYPIEIQEVLPGDSLSNKTTAVFRVSSGFAKPVLDNAWVDVYSFFVPLRLCYDDLEKVFGVAQPSMYLNGELSRIPVTSERSIVSPGSVADYLGLPLGKVPEGISILPFRAFALIYNEWFRNENIVDEVYVQKGDFNSLAESINNNAWAPNNYTGKLPTVSKKKDYFTSCLPKPQKGNAVYLPISEIAPVKTANQQLVSGPQVPLNFSVSVDGTPAVNLSGATGDIKTPLFMGRRPGDYAPNSGSLYSSINSGDFEALNPTTDRSLYPNNLYADLSQSINVNVNDLRFAFQLQKMLERDALYGSRYNEYLLGHFGVVNPDARLQFTEYLGGGRIPIQIQQVATTSTNENGKTAELGAYSLSAGYAKYSKGFTEHGYVITVGCIRTEHSYSQGVPKLFMRSERNDFYDPLYANLGEQPVYSSELYCNSDDSTLKGNVFGYNEAWAEYRYAPNRITGEMRPNRANGFDVWSFGDNFSGAPPLGEAFIREVPNNFDRTVYVPSSVDDNFICDFYFDTKAIRVMPAYSVPGLIDHH